MIGREDKNGPQGDGVMNVEYGNGDKASTLKQRDYKDATDLVVEDI
jgi:hypothetical protein